MTDRLHLHPVNAAIPFVVLASIAGAGAPGKALAPGVRLIAPFAGGRAPIFAAGGHAPIFDPAGERWVRGCSDGTVRVVELATGKTLQCTEPRAVATRHVEFSRDGARLLATWDDGRVAIFESADFRTVLDVEHPDAIPEEWVFAAFAPGGGSCVSWQWDGTLALWDVGASAPRFTQRLPGLRSVRGSPDGRWIAAGSSGGVQLIDAAAPHDVRRLASDGWSATDFAFHPREPLLAIACTDMAVRIVELPALSLSSVLPHERGDLFMEELHWVEWRDDGAVLLSASGGKGTARAHDAGGKHLWSHAFSGGNMSTLFARFDASGERVFVSGQTPDKRYVVDAFSGEILRELDAGTDGGIRPVPGGKLVVHGDAVLDARTFAVRYRRFEMRSCSSLVFAPSLHFAGTPEAVSAAWLELDGDVFPLECFEPLLHDPELVARAARGDPVAAPQIPRPPETFAVHPDAATLSVLRDGRVVALNSDDAPARLRLWARSPNGIARFDVEWNGVRTDDETLRDAVTLHERGGDVQFTLVIPPAWRIEPGELAIRALGNDRTRSAPVRFRLVPSGENDPIDAAAVADTGLHDARLGVRDHEIVVVGRRGELVTVKHLDADGVVSRSTDVGRGDVSILSVAAGDSGVLVAGRGRIADGEVAITGTAEFERFFVASLRHEDDAVAWRTVLGHTVDRVAAAGSTVVAVGSSVYGAAATCLDGATGAVTWTRTWEGAPWGTTAAELGADLHVAFRAFDPRKRAILARISLDDGSIVKQIAIPGIDMDLRAICVTDGGIVLAGGCAGGLIRTERGAKPGFSDPVHRDRGDRLGRDDEGDGFLVLVDGDLSRIVTSTYVGGAGLDTVLAAAPAQGGGVFFVASYASTSLLGGAKSGTRNVAVARISGDLASLEDVRVPSRTQLMMNEGVSDGAFGPGFVALAAAGATHAADLSGIVTIVSLDD